MKDVLKGKSEKDILKSFDKGTDANILLNSSIRNGMLIGVKKSLDLGADIHAFYDFSIKNTSMNGFADIVEYLLNFTQFDISSLRISLENAILGVKFSPHSSQYRKIVDLLESKIKEYES